MVRLITFYFSGPVTLIHSPIHNFHSTVLALLGGSYLTFPASHPGTSFTEE